MGALGGGRVCAEGQKWRIGLVRQVRYQVVEGHEYKLSFLTCPPQALEGHCGDSVMVSFCPRLVGAETRGTTPSGSSCDGVTMGGGAWKRTLNRMVTEEVENRDKV